MSLIPKPNNNPRPPVIYIKTQYPDCWTYLHQPTHPVVRLAIVDSALGPSTIEEPTPHQLPTHAPPNRLRYSRIRTKPTGRAYYRMGAVRGGRYPEHLHLTCKQPRLPRRVWRSYTTTSTTSPWRRSPNSTSLITNKCRYRARVGTNPATQDVHELEWE